MGESMSAKTQIKMMPGIFSGLLLILGGSFVIAQTPQPTQQQRTVSETLDSWITNTENHVVPVAEAMPEEKYSFAPPIAYGEFKGVRTFAEQVKHLAANNYAMAAMIKGEAPTPEMANESGPESVRSKTEIVNYLRGSFEALHKSMAIINLKNVVEQIKTPSSWQKTRLSVAEDAVAHSFDHYGQLVEYLRMNGIVPPDSR